MAEVRILRAYCKGCALCVALCPTKCLRLSHEVNDVGTRPAEPVEGATDLRGARLMASGERVLMTGNEAAAEGAIRAGCRFYFGYPITPQNDLPEYMARRMPEVGGTFIQAESELAAISMVHGASAAGARAMTSSSSPGISLKQEGLSYMAGSEPVLAPYTVQETFDLAGLGLDLAMKWRTPVLILSDQQVGQMMEPVDLPPVGEAPEGEAPWALRGAAPGQERKYIHSYCGRVGELVAWNVRLKKKMEQIAAEEVRFEAVETADAEVVLVAYGITGKGCRELIGYRLAAG